LTGRRPTGEDIAVPDLPWVAVANREPAKEYVALASYLPLRRLTSTPVFVLDVRRIMSQLGRAPGLLGYSLRARPLRKQYWTLSVWESDRALLEFVRGQPHATVMGALRSRMGPTAFVRWRVSGAGPLPTWDDAMARITAPEMS
jgi:heme-degrading monooxygenase HmoA